MRRKLENVSDSITDRTNVRLPIGLIAGIVVSIAAAWWAQFEKHREYDNTRFTDLREYIDKKASDRYTSSEARQHQESVEQRFSDVEKKNDQQHVSLQRQIDRLSSTCIRK